MIAIIYWALNSFSQEFGTHWISHPMPNDSSEVLFCKVYTSTQRPQKAYLSFASSGVLKVFVNERNITKDIYFANQVSDIIDIHTFDVTRFLRPDSNAIAVWFAPQNGAEASKQLSLEYYGYNSQGDAFYHKADQEWKCQILKGSFLKDNKEIFDARNYSYNWKAVEYDRETWLAPWEILPDKNSLYSSSISQFTKKHRSLYHIISPSNSYNDNEEAQYDFGREFLGTCRITLRGTRKGEIINMNGLTYICNGELDEQVFHHFTTHALRIVTIQGDDNFTPSQITHIEGLEY